MAEASEEVAISSRFIINIVPFFQISGWQELRHICPGIKKLRDFKNGALLIESPLSRDEFIRTMVCADPVFTRHLMPVQTEMRISGKREKDFALILAQVYELCALKPGDRFSVQCRRMGTYYDYRTRDVEVYVGQDLQAKGGVPIFSEPNRDQERQIISVFLFLNKGYIGCSTAKENLNGASDINLLFFREEPVISRAEFKLREALCVFELDIEGGKALDLGAAPGGWTKVLADCGAHVTAVDPGELNPLVKAIPQVRHIASRLAEWSCDQQYDLIVNAMNVVPKETVSAMIGLKNHLKPGAYAIVTVKLIRERHPRKLLQKTVRDLASVYEIIRVKHLFHNRREVTLFLKPK